MSQEKQKPSPEKEPATQAPTPAPAVRAAIEPLEEIKPEETPPPEANGMAKRSVDVRRFMTAMARAQGEVLNAKKSQENIHFKTHYADLAAIADACRTALSKNLIAWVQIPCFTESEIWLETTLTHGPSGQYVTGTYPIPNNVRNNSQSLVAAFTYARRNSLAMMVGVVSEDEDQDGNDIPRTEGQEDRSEGREPAAKSQNTRKAEEWADWAAGRKIPGFKNAEELTAWEEKHNADIAGLAKLSPDHHAKVKKALDDAGARFGLVTGGQSDELGEHA